MLEQEDRPKPDTHPVPTGNYVIEVGNYVTVSPSQLRNSVIVHTDQRVPQRRLTTPRTITSTAKEQFTGQNPDFGAPQADRPSQCNSADRSRPQAPGLVRMGRRCRGEPPSPNRHYIYVRSHTRR